MTTRIGVGISDPKVFKYWSELARDDPERFERERREETEEFIAKASSENEERLRRLQWRIDRERERASNPLSSCLRLSTMMWDFVTADTGFLNTLKGSMGLLRSVTAAGPYTRISSEPARQDARRLAPQAQIIAFKKK